MRLFALKAWAYWWGVLSVVFLAEGVLTLIGRIHPRLTVDVLFALGCIVLGSVFYGVAAIAFRQAVQEKRLQEAPPRAVGGGQAVEHSQGVTPEDRRPIIG